MKKVFLSLFAVAALGLSANAQQVVKFGPKAGVNIASLNGGEGDTDMKIGFHVGAFAEIFFTDKFALQPEIVYSDQGNKYKNSETIAGISYTEEGKGNLSYINVPIMAKYYVIEGLAVELGPQVGFLMSAKEKYEQTMSGGGTSVTEETEEDIKDYMNSVDFGLGVGANYNLSNGFFAGARYNLGFSDIFKDNEGDAVKNGVIQISVGYKF